jgi:hypothetical protein
LYHIPFILQEEAEDWLCGEESHPFALAQLMMDGARKFEGLKEKISACYLDITGLTEHLLNEGIEDGSIVETTDVKSLSIEIVSLLDGLQVYAAMVGHRDMKELFSRSFYLAWIRIGETD